MQMVCDSQCNLVAVVPVRVESKKGVTIRAETEANEKVIIFCRLVHERLPCSGTYNIQLILTESGDVIPFEINPRISTTFCLVVAAGIDPIQAFAAPYDKANAQTFSSGVSVHRHYYNYFSGS